MNPEPGMTTSFGSLDGHLQPLDGLSIPATDRGLLLGDAVFETLRTYDGRLFALQAHLERLEASMAAIHLQDPPPSDSIAHWTREATRASLSAQRETGTTEACCVVRITVTRGDGPHGISTRGTGPARVIVIARPLPPPKPSVYTQGLRVITASIQRAPIHVQDPTIKATSALNLILARREADESGADEALLTNANGDYLEASAASLFVLQDSGYWTPQGDHGVLEGVTAAITKELLADAGWQPHLGPIPADVLRSADEVLLTQTTREILPVVRIDENNVKSGRPGPMAARLREAFQDRLGRHLDLQRL